MYKLLKQPDGQCYWENSRFKFRPIATIACKKEVYDRIQIVVGEGCLVVAGLMSIVDNKAGPYTRIAWLPQEIVDVLKKLPKISSMKGAKHEPDAKT